MWGAGGDPPASVHGGVCVIYVSTGQVKWTWNVDPKANEGGSVWGAIAYDGTNLIFGTGNTCQTPVMDLNGHVLWARSMQNRLVGYVAVVPGLGFVGLN